MYTLIGRLVGLPVIFFWIQLLYNIKSNTMVWPLHYLYNSIDLKKQQQKTT